MTLETFTDVFIIEFKADTAEPPLGQIERRRYGEKYQDLGKRIHLGGITFSAEERNVTAWEKRRMDA